MNAVILRLMAKGTQVSAPRRRGGPFPVWVRHFRRGQNVVAIGRTSYRETRVAGLTTVYAGRARFPSTRNDQAPTERRSQCDGET